MARTRTTDLEEKVEYMLEGAPSRFFNVQGLSRSALCDRLNEHRESPLGSGGNSFRNAISDNRLTRELKLNLGKFFPSVDFSLPLNEFKEQVNHIVQDDNFYKKVSFSDLLMTSAESDGFLTKQEPLLENKKPLHADPLACIPRKYRKDILSFFANDLMFLHVKPWKSGYVTIIVNGNFDDGEWFWLYPNRRTRPRIESDQFFKAAQIDSVEEFKRDGRSYSAMKRNDKGNAFFLSCENCLKKPIQLANTWKLNDLEYCMNDCPNAILASETPGIYTLYCLITDYPIERNPEIFRNFGTSHEGGCIDEPFQEKLAALIVRNGMSKVSIRNEQYKSLGQKLQKSQFVK